MTLDPCSVPLSLYVHLPWCVRKCPYCDFNSYGIHQPVPEERYVDALLLDLEIELDRIGGRGIQTVFFGGGTPSLFSPEAFARILEFLRVGTHGATGSEVTLEANPGTMERGRFAEYHAAGVTRISLGAQSFDDRLLGKIGRIHTSAQTTNAIEEIRAAGFENFNIDLMYGLPGQTITGALEDVRTACEFEPTHVSHYQLTLEPGTAFERHPPQLPDQDACWEMHRECAAMLSRDGFDRYEISAFARPGFECRHNLNYWRFGDYLGIGAGAHGKLSLTRGIVRTRKHARPGLYLDRAFDRTPTAAEDWLAPSDRAFEFMLNNLRLTRGFSRHDFEGRTGLAIGSVRGLLDQAVQRGLLEPLEHGWHPTALGLRFLNDLQALFLPGGHWQEHRA